MCIFIIIMLAVCIFDFRVERWPRVCLSCFEWKHWKGSFPPKVCPPVYTVVHAVAQMRKHWKTVKCRKWDWQMNTHTICCYCIYRYLTRETMQNIPESLYVYSYWDGIFAWMDESTSWLNSENMPTLFFEEPLFIAHGSKFDNCCNLHTFNCHYQLRRSGDDPLR